MDIADIITEFGAYYINSGQNLSRVYKQLMAPSETDALLTPIFTDDTVYRASEARMTRVLQPFQKSWTPIAEVEFLPVSIPLFKQKVDNDLDDLDDLEGSWLGFLAGEDIDRAQWPFVRWYVEQHLLPQVKQDYELNEVYAGDYAAPVAGTAGAAGTSMNGIKFVINEHIDDGRITPIVTGALSSTAATFLAQVEAFVASVNKNYWKIPMQLNMSYDKALLYRQAFDVKYNTYYAQEDSQIRLKYFPNVTINGLRSMGTSQKLWMTPKSNAVKLNKKTQNQNIVRIESRQRVVSLFSDWWCGVGFIIPEIVFTNDQELNP